MNSTRIYIEKNKWNHGDRIIAYSIVDRLNCILSFSPSRSRSISFAILNRIPIPFYPIIKHAAPFVLNLDIYSCFVFTSLGIFSHLLTVFILIIFLLKNHNRQKYVHTILVKANLCSPFNFQTCLEYTTLVRFTLTFSWC